jgi:hypothetical protein
MPPLELWTHVFPLDRLVEVNVVKWLTGSHKPKHTTQFESHSRHWLPWIVPSLSCVCPLHPSVIFHGLVSSGLYEGVSKSFRTGRLERELQMVQLSATRCGCIAILWVSLVSFAAITLCVASQRVFVVVVCFVIDSVRKLLDTPSNVTILGGSTQR